MSEPKRPPHPGEYLEQLLRGYQLEQTQLAEHIGTYPGRISALVHKRAMMSPELAMSLEQTFGVSAQFWMHTQAMYDLRRWKRENLIPRRDRLYPPKNFHGPTCFDRCVCGHWGWHHKDYPDGPCLEEFCRCDKYEMLGDLVKKVTREVGYTEEKKTWR